MFSQLLFILILATHLSAEPLFTQDSAAFPYLKNQSTLDHLGTPPHSVSAHHESFLVSEDSLELHVSILVDRSSLKWQETDSGAQAAYEGRLRLRSGGQVVYEEVWRRSDSADSIAQVLAAQKIPDALSIVLPAQKYRVELQLLDLNSREVGQRTFPLRLTMPSGSNSLSDMLLSLSPPVLAESPPFLLGGARVIPYADAVFGSGLNEVFAQCALLLDADVDVTVSVYLLGDRQNVLKSTLAAPLDSFAYAQKTLHNGRRLIWLSASQDVRELPTSTYFFELRVMVGQETLASTRHTFFIENPGVEALSLARYGDEYELYDSAQLTTLWERSSILASHDELQAWDRLDLQERRSFLRQFWERRDHSPESKMNEARAAFLLRIEEARQRFTEPGHSGEQTDRGRIYARYGEADYIDTDVQILSQYFPLEFENYRNQEDRRFGSNSFTESLSGREHNDFQMWRFDYLEGGSEFIFIDVQGFGNYELVHSTKTGEFFDPQWVRKLYR
jgi:GWxTD domain-containing protein